MIANCSDFDEFAAGNLEVRVGGKNKILSQCTDLYVNVQAYVADGASFPSGLQVQDGTAQQNCLAKPN